MTVLFRSIKTAPLTVQSKSRETLTYIIKVMKMIGWILPRQDGVKRYLYLIWSIISFGFATNFFLGMFFALIINFEDFTPGDFFNVLTGSINVAGGNFKSLIVIKSFPILRNLLLGLDELDKVLLNNDGRKKINKAVALGNYVFLIYSRFYIGYTIACLIAALFIGHPPWLLYNPFFDWHDGRIQFWIQVIIEYIMSLIIVFDILIVDTGPLILMIIIRAHMDVLKDKIFNLRCDPRKTEEENHIDLVSCIKYHKSLRNCCDLMRPIISRVIFTQYILIGCVLGIGLINVMYISSVYNIISSTIFFIAVLLETFPFSYSCDLLVQDCEDLSNALAQSQWIDAEPKYKSTLKIFMHHVQQPFNFNAGGIFPVTMNTNIKVAKFAFTVVTVVQQMDLAERFK